MKKIFYLLIILLLTGCQNYRELNDLAIVTALSIDYNTEEEEYTILAQVINTANKKESTSSENSSFTLYKSSASSLSSAINNNVLSSPKKFYLNQIQIIIISKEILEHHLNNTLDYILRNPEIRGETSVILAPDDKDLNAIAIEPLLEDLSSSSILSSLNNSYKEGLSSKITINDLADMYLNPHKEIIIPTLYITGDIDKGNDKENKESSIPKSSVHIGGSAITKDSKVIRLLTLDETKYLNILRKESKNTNINLPYQESYLSFNLYNLNTKYKLNTKTNTITLTLTGKAKSFEVVTNTDIESISNVKDIRRSLNNYLERKLTVTYQNISKDTDAFNYSDMYYKKKPKLYYNWYQDIFPNLKLKIKSEIELYEKGTIKEDIKYAKENK